MTGPGDVRGTNGLRRFYFRLIVPPDPFRFDPAVDSRVRELCQAAGPESLILNLGSGRTRFGPAVVNLDLRSFPGVDVRGNAEALPFCDGMFAGALLRGVLEHVRLAELVRDETKRVLRPGGFIYVEVPFLQPFHASPEDYRRFTLPGLQAFLSDFSEEDAGVQIGPVSSLAWVAREALAALFSFGSPRAYPKVLTLAAWATFWLKHLDRLVVPAPFVAHAASAVYFLGRKRG